MIGTRYSEAVRLAVFAHDGQVRKGTDIPYAAHPIAVSALALQFGADEDQAIIAVCHDMVEDCGGHWATTLRNTFGDRVADGVLGCSDSAKDGKPKMAWRQRKEAYIAHLATASYDVALVSLCDKLQNAGCIVSDLETMGSYVFTKFVGGREGTLWYYQALLIAFRARGDLPHKAMMEYQAMVHRMLALCEPRNETFN